MRTAALGLLLAWLPIPYAGAQVCQNTSVGHVPLTDLGPGFYQGFQGGLYPFGSNERPLDHEVAGLLEAAQVVPRNASGVVDDNGKIGFISIGMSNCMIHFDAFMQAAALDTAKNPRVVLANCAQSGKTAQIIANPNAPYWTNWVPARLAAAGLSAAQVQAVWFLECDAHPNLPFPEDALALKSEFIEIMGNLRADYPNLRLCYTAARMYAGYATTSLNPEPFAYQQGFANKWLIEDQLIGNPLLNYDPSKGTVVSPWIAWGPYMWADGLTPRSDGLSWVCPDDYEPDGTHPSTVGAAKYAAHLLDFMHADSTAQSWYLAEPSPVVYGTGKTTSLGITPTVSWSGTSGVGGNQFEIHLSGGIPGRPVIGMWSTRAAIAPLFQGTLLLSSPIHRMNGQLLDQNGGTTYDLNVVPPWVGDTRNYQFWFRDPQQLDGTGAGLSNALQVRFFD